VPFTPLHFGPGALAKSVAPKWFSFRAFIISQVVIDSETAWNIYRGHARLHAIFHTYAGATIAMLLTAVLIFGYNVIAWRFPKMWLVRELEDWGEPFRRGSSLIAILSGGWSHVFLDSLMHTDQRPFAPFSTSNAMLDLISNDLLHISCLSSFVAAVVVWGTRRLVRRRI
jgi:membrane-bound metal-dependent hydrolase YbcI (DUF457 family)